MSDFLVIITSINYNNNNNGYVDDVMEGLAVESLGVSGVCWERKIIIIWVNTLFIIIN